MSVTDWSAVFTEAFNKSGVLNKRIRAQDPHRPVSPPFGIYPGPSCGFGYYTPAATNWF